MHLIFFHIKNSLNVFECTNATFFAATNICGNCSTGKRYDVSSLRCACDPGFIQDATGNCSACSGANYANANHECLPLNVGAAPPFPNPSIPPQPSDVIPCAPGKALFLANNQYVCVDAVVISYKPNIQTCAATHIWSATFQRCYRVIPIPADILANLSSLTTEAFYTCSLGTSAKACVSLHNQCIQTQSTSSEICNLYKQLATSLNQLTDVYKPLFVQRENQTAITPELDQNATLDFLQQNQNTPKIHVQISDLEGNIFYNDNAFDGIFSLCAFLRSQQTQEQTYLNPAANKQFENRRSQYGFVNRLLKNNDFAPNDIFYRKTNQYPRFTRYSDYEEKCSFGEIVTNQSLFLSFYVLSIDNQILDVPVFVNSANNGNFGSIGPEIAVGKIFYFDDQKKKYLQKFNLKMGVNFNQQQLVAPYIEAFYADISTDSNKVAQFVQDFSYMTGRLQMQLLQNKFTFNVSYVNINPLDDLKIAAIAITVIVGGMVAGIQCCKQCGSTSACACRDRIEPRYNKKAKKIEEKTRKNIFYFFEFISYFVGYIGIGFYIYFVIQQIQLLLDSGLVVTRPASFLNNQQNIKLEECIAGYVCFLIFFMIRIYQKSQTQFFFASASDIGTTNTNWRLQMVTNKIQELQNNRPCNLDFCIIFSLIIYVFCDVQYFGTPAAYFSQTVYSLNPVWCATTYCAIFNLVILCCNFVQMLYHFAVPSQFLKFQELLNTSKMHCVIRDTDCSMCIIKGDCLPTVGDSLANIINIAQKIRRKHVQLPENFVQRIYISHADSSYFQFIQYLDYLKQFNKINTRIVKEQSVFKIRQYSNEQKEYYNTIISQVQAMTLECNAVELTGYFQPCLPLDIRKLNQTEIKSFMRQRNRTFPTLQNPQYKCLFMYTMLYYEAIFIGLSLYMWSVVTGSFTAAFLMAMISYYIYKIIVRKMIATNISLVNQIQTNFLGYFAD